MCNREIKFGVFRAYAKSEGFAAVATGHYARRVEAATTITGEVSSGGRQTPSSVLRIRPPAPCWRASTRTRTSPTSWRYCPKTSSATRAFRSVILRKPELRTIAADHGLVTSAKKGQSGDLLHR